MKFTHGGARDGAGRKPKALKNAPPANILENRIAEALPGIVENLIRLAANGDVTVSRYLNDRILPRVASLKVAPSVDPRTQYSDSELHMAGEHYPKED